MRSRFFLSSWSTLQTSHQSVAKVMHQRLQSVGSVNYAFETILCSLVDWVIVGSSACL